MTRSRRLPLRPVLLLAGAAALGGPGALAAPPQKVQQVCATCHGIDGLSKIPMAPNIAGHPEMYIVKALENYRSGARKDEMMTIIAKDLTDAEIAELAAWYSSLQVSVTVPE